MKIPTDVHTDGERETVHTRNSVL